MKRSYFGRDTEERVLLGGGVEAMKGVYQSIRAAEVFGTGPLTSTNMLI